MCVRGGVEKGEWRALCGGSGVGIGRAPGKVYEGIARGGRNTAESERMLRLASESVG